MNVSELDCPQYVCFNSEEFLRDASRMSVDSLDNSEKHDLNNLSAISGLLSPTEESQAEKVSLESTRYDYTETSDIDKENIGDLTNQTDSFPIMQARATSGAGNRNPMRVTVPKPFHFQTDNRLKSKAADEVHNYEKKDFVAELRHNTVSQTHKRLHVTRPQPFNLTEAKKRKHEDTYLSMAEQVAAFQKKTPERYHSSSNKEYQPQGHWSPPRLVAKTPKLQACKRRRVVHVMSKEEQENKEIEEMKAYEFHAKPVDPKIYRRPLTLRSQPTNRIRTSDFRLKTTQRAVNHLRNKTKSPKEKYVFKARPVPKAMLSGPTGLKEKPVIHLTEAKSPEFVSDTRLEKRKIHELEKKKEQEELLQKKEAQKKRTSSAPNPPCVPYVKKLTIVQPFSFDKKDQERFSDKEKKIREEIERESKPFVFHAQPILEPPPLPVIPKQPVTEVRPFNFLLDNRVSKSNNLSFDTINTTFKARPATVLKKDPFIPEKPPKQSIEMAEFNLHTDKRASDRQHLKELKEQEELELQRVLQEQRALEEERERQELMQLRREIVHKANPVRHYKPVEVQPSAIPLTQPQSPNFETDKRIQKRHDQSCMSQPESS